MEYLSLDLVEGKPRQTATLLVFVESGRWRACVNDRDSESSFFRSSESFLGLLESLESALSNGTADWRARPQRKR